MKKILAIVMAVAMVMALSVTAFAAETEIEVSTDNFGYHANATAVDGGLNSSESEFTLNLLESLEIGDTITLHFKGTSDGDFRVWLVDGAVTASEQWYSNQNGFSGGEFDFEYTFTVQNWNDEGATGATGVDFKGIAYGTNLDNFTLTYLAVVTDGEEVAAETTDDADATEETSEEVADTTDSTDTSSTETTTSTNADTGVVLAVLPMAVAATAVVASKRR